MISINLLFVCRPLLFGCNFLITIGSFLLTSELLYLQVCLGAYLLTIDVCCLQLELFGLHFRQSRPVVSSRWLGPFPEKATKYEKEKSEDHDHICTKSFLRESWSWSSFFSSLAADFQRTMTTCVARLRRGNLGHGHRLFHSQNNF